MYVYIYIYIYIFLLLGIQDSNDQELTGFIPKANLDSTSKNRIKGEVIECVIEAVSKATLTLTADPSTVNTTSLDAKAWDFDALQAGMLVPATVVQVLENGIELDFLGLFHGTVSMPHLGQSLASFRVNQEVTARILYVHFEKRRVGFSLLPNIIANSPFTFPTSAVRGLVRLTS